MFKVRAAKVPPEMSNWGFVTLVRIEAARALTAFKGDRIGLKGLRDIDRATAQALAFFKGHVEVQAHIDKMIDAEKN